jgi:plastocyanin domain-containing protein
MMTRIGTALLALTLLVGCQGWPGGTSREFQVNVTENGFEPDQVVVHKGDTVTLVVTRRTEETCATEVVVPDRGIRKDLPLNQPVRLAIGPVENGPIEFACGMDMYKGKVVAQ